jgi:hypothetical protein
MSHTQFSTWLAAKKTVAGLLALVVSVPGQPALIETCGSPAPGASFETAWRALSEAIPVLQLNDFPTACFRFVFEQALIHCERREDGVCIGVFARHGQTRLPPAQLERLLAEFHAL